MSSVDDDETQVPESLQENQGAEVEDDMVDDVLQPQHCNFPFRFFSLNYAILHYQFFSLNTAILHCRFFSLNIAIFHGRFFSLNTAILHCRFFSLNTAILHCRFFSLNTAILHGRFFCLNTAILHCWLFTLNTTILHCIFFSLNTAIHCIVKQIYVLSSSFMVMKSGKRCESLLNYIGLTSRELKVRTREHVRDIRAARDIVDAEALASLKTLPKHFRSFHESDPSGLKSSIQILAPSSPTHFLDHFYALLLHFMFSELKTLILGDFNSSSSPTASQLLYLANSRGISQLSDSETHKDEYTFNAHGIECVKRSVDSAICGSQQSIGRLESCNVAEKRDIVPVYQIKGISKLFKLCLPKVQCFCDSLTSPPSERQNQPSRTLR
ncbi:unnamed protein product [Ranitomeya imitator]|uniref:Uncharacterized protein n=1 Tax=Ranitomeya imitator TaxID=111125 RepID=A0ABN9MC68_9NEOB|nr:unnamed protein product [Ranitomeya imitator]